MRTPGRKMQKCLFFSVSFAEKTGKVSMIVREDNRRKVIEKQCYRIGIFQHTNSGTHEFQCARILVHANIHLTGEDFSLIYEQALDMSLRLIEENNSLTYALMKVNI